jgi:hypothetical protein
MVSVASSNRVFGQQLTIFVNIDGNDHYVANIDSFNWKFDNVVKTNAALGQAGKGTIDVIDDGVSGLSKQMQFYNHG